MTGLSGKYGRSPFLLKKDFYYFMAVHNAKALKVPWKWWLLTPSSCLASKGHGMLQGCGARLQGDTNKIWMLQPQPDLKPLKIITP